MNQEKPNSTKKYTSLYIDAALLSRFDKLAKQSYQSRSARLTMLIQKDVERKCQLQEKVEE